MYSCCDKACKIKIKKLWKEGIIRRCEVVDIAETVREASMRLYGNVIRDEGKSAKNIME
jgi:hypothetical protein